jgi:energy-coupling factor transport system permease protein
MSTQSLFDRLFSHYETDSPLGRWNPAAKAMAVLAVSLLLTAIFDPVTPLVILIVSILITVLLGRVSFVAILAGLAPATALAAGLVWTNLFFGRAEGRLWWHWGPFSLSEASLIIGLSLGLRVLCFASYSLLFLTTTDPSRFILSLIQHLRVPYRFGYAMLAVYRFLPMLGYEFLLIRGAQRIRGVPQRRGVRGWVQGAVRYMIPLLAAALRRAERVAIAMEARGLGPGLHRTYYRYIPMRARDIGAAIALIGVNALIIAVSWKLGVLRVWHGQLY